MMSLIQQRMASPPMGLAPRSRRRAPDELSRILQFKGFAGGVPQNTETTTVKPWVGISPDIKRCLLFVEWRMREDRNGKCRILHGRTFSNRRGSLPDSPAARESSIQSRIRRFPPSLHLILRWVWLRLHPGCRSSPLQFHKSRQI